MTSIIRMHGLSGLSGSESAPCYILQIDEFHVLLDCGWDESLDVEDVFIKDVKKYINRIDAVLITHPDLQHLGALPYLVGKCGLSCPIYATVPVYKMGQMFLYDFVLSKQAVEDFQFFDLDDVDSAFDKMIQLKYNQSLNLKGKGYGLTITPLPGGHMIGGTIWKIVKVGEEDIYYAVDYNHKKERHLNGCELEKIQRPSLFITDSYNVTYAQERRRTRDEQLMTKILQTLRNGGNVLLAVDTAGRVLELAHMLDQLWRNKESGLAAFSLALLNNVAFNVIEFAKQMIEWMSDKLMRSFEGARNNPFQFKNLHICHSLAELNKISSPKVVLASTPDLETGFSRDLFMQWCQDIRNCVILTTRTNPGTLGRLLIDDPSPKVVELVVKQKVKLEGRELDEYYRLEREKEYRTKNEKRDTVLDSDDSDDDSDTEIKITGVFHGNRISHDLFIKAGMESKVEAGLFKSSKSKYPIYPYYEEKIKYDEYGEFIRPEDFVITETIPDSNVTIKSNKKSAKLYEAEDEQPTKCVVSKQSFAVNCQIQFIDFEGRSDGESVQKIIEQMKPRRLIITRGSDQSAAILSGICQQTSPDSKIFIPSNANKILDVTTESNIYQVKLKDALVSSLVFKRGKDAELAWVDGHINLDDDEAHEKDTHKVKIEDAIEESVPTLEPWQTPDVPPHPTVFVNDLKLSDFKQVLSKHNIPSEFSGGVLWCANGTIALRRQEAGRLMMEGCVSDEYYVIRDLLYDQYAIL